MRNGNWVGPVLWASFGFSESIMKAFFSMVLALGLCCVAGARDEKVDPVGTWKCEYGGDGRICILTISGDGDKLTGTMSWPKQKDPTIPTQKETAVKDLKRKGHDLEFSVVRKSLEEGFTLEHKITIKGDKLKGKVEMEIMGTKQEFEIIGTREKKEK